MGSSLRDRIGSAFDRRPGGLGNRRRPTRRRARVREVEALEPRLVLATFTVTSPLDAGPGTLRDAIEQANRDRDADVIAFDPALDGPIVLSGPLPGLRGELKIEGPDDARVAIVRDAAPETPAFRIFDVLEDAEVTLRNLTIVGGRADFGGAIRNAGRLTVDAGDLVGNRASFQGGAVYSTGQFALVGSTVRDNVAESVETLGYGPTAIGRGGALFNTGVAVILNSTVSDNLANREGGAVWNDNALFVRNSTLSGNAAEGFIVAGGLVPVGSGGAIFNRSLVQIDTSTIAGNRANREAGGLFSNVTRRRFEESTIRSSILAENLGGDVVIRGIPVASQGFNLFGTTGRLATEPTDLIGVDPMLGPLGDYGGPVPVRALLPGSPAIDAGLFNPDHRYSPRFVERFPGATDIGADEAIGFTASAVSGDGQSAPPGSPFAEPLVIGVAPNYTIPTAGGRITFIAPAEGPSAILVGNPAPFDDDGRAEVRAIANGIPGTFTVVARAPGGQDATFTLTNEGTPPPPADPSPSPAGSAATVPQRGASTAPRDAPGGAVARPFRHALERLLAARGAASARRP